MDQTHTLADCQRDGIREGNMEHTRRYIAHFMPHPGILPGKSFDSELADTLDAASLAHAYNRYEPILGAIHVMESVRGDYQEIRDWADRYRETGILWAGEVVAA